MHMKKSITALNEYQIQSSVIWCRPMIKKKISTKTGLRSGINTGYKRLTIRLQIYDNF